MGSIISEFLKLKRSMSWSVVILLPVLMVFFGSFSTFVGEGEFTERRETDLEVAVGRAVVPCDPEAEEHLVADQGEQRVGLVDHRATPAPLGPGTSSTSPPPDVSLVATAYSSAGEFTADDGAEPDLLVRTGPPSSGPSGPLSLAPVPHERFLPHVKHVGELAKTHLLRRAVDRGFDDAVFVDRRGRLGEATIWNLAFWDGAGVVWPDAEVLPGTTMGIVRRQLERRGVRQRFREVAVEDLPDLAGAVVMNSWTPGVAIDRIGSVRLPDATPLVELLHAAVEAEALVEP